MEWTEEQVLEMVSLYEDHRELWDPQHPHYKLVTKKSDAWSEISQNMDIPVDDIKKKMQSLLASYRRERQKCDRRVSEMGIDDIYKGTWFLFKHFSFLNNKYKLRERNSADEDITIGENTNLNEEESNETDILVTQDRIKECKKRKPEDELLQRSEISLKRTKEETKGSEKAEGDVFEKFGSYVAEELKQLDARTSTIAIKYINDIIFNAKVGKYDKNCT
ncbi:uncharacterized protein LOC143186509 [Calliopsis andreniformis]|uniref:uncharacterized protein LOC143186509 n=1 Tax=Calliopsis andreniformis TaxID=337506 RepID=UPI003FCDDDE6